MTDMNTMHISKVVQDLITTTQTDSQLLDRFLANRNESAFAMLVRRHGPMVWGVCKRVVGHHQNAEDAFQAVFLLLARKAHTIRPKSMLPNWLHGVAYRTSLKARTIAWKTKSREKDLNSMSEPSIPETPSADPVEKILDEELAQLPERNRIAIVLCDLEGKTAKQAAVQLNIPEATLASRLRTGRIRLAKRLSKRGITLSAGALATHLSLSSSKAAISDQLLSKVSRHAIGNCCSSSETLTVTNDNVHNLTVGMMKTMLLGKLKALTFGCIALTAIGIGGLGLEFQQAFGDQETTSRKDSSPEPKQKTNIDRVDPTVDATELHSQNTNDDDGNKKEEKARRVVATYPVASLVIPIPDLEETNDGIERAKDTDKAIQDRAQWLMKRIMSSVAKESWMPHGGNGTIEFYSEGKAFVINHTPAIQSRVKKMLQTMEKFQLLQVSTDIRLIRTSEKGVQQLKQVFKKLGHDDQFILTENDGQKLIEESQKLKDSKVIACPRPTTFSGQRIRLQLECQDDFKKLDTIDLRMTTNIHADLQHVDLNFALKIGKKSVGKRIILEEGSTIVNRAIIDGDTYLILVTPSVIHSMFDEAGLEVAPPTANAATSKAKNK